MAMLRVGPEGTQSPFILSQDTGMKPGGSGQGQRKVGGCRYREGHPKADSYGMYTAPMCKDREEAPGRGAGLERAWTGWGKDRAHVVPQVNPSEEGWKREEMELSLGYLRLFIHPFSKR